jgi:hypothetical protein
MLRCSSAPFKPALLVLVMSLGACHDDEPNRVDAGVADVGAGDGGGTSDSSTADATIDVPLAAGKAKLDLLFMIDNSIAMVERQRAFAAAVPALFEALSAGKRGAPDLHFGVISSSVGAGPTPVGSQCPPGGDRGRMQVLPGCGLDASEEGFVRFNPGGYTNIPGADSLAKVAACLVPLGMKGCGLEHQLMSLYFALDGKTNVEQNAFLRDDAVLAVILLSDEDDCSGRPDADFFSDPIPGQDHGLRCSLKGHVCGGKAIPEAPFVWPLSDCAPSVSGSIDDKSHLVDVSFFVDFLKSRKPDPDRDLFVGSIIGWSEDPAAQYRITEVTVPTGPQLWAAPICQDQVAGSAAPGIRLHAFTKSFPHNAVFTICEPDLSGPLAAMGVQIAGLLAP